MSSRLASCRGISSVTSTKMISPASRRSKCTKQRHACCKYKDKKCIWHSTTDFRAKSFRVLQAPGFHRCDFCMPAVRKEWTAVVGLHISPGQGTKVGFPTQCEGCTFFFVRFSFSQSTFQSTPSVRLALSSLSRT